LDRDPAKVLDDVLDGFFGPEHAKSDYGVVLKPVDDGYDWALDEASTESLRAEMRA
jgi:N-methylhydantoinase B